MKTIFTILIIFILSLSSIYAQNDDYSKLTLKISGLRIFPDEDCDVENWDLSISNEYAIGISLNYFFNKNLAVELSLSSSKHDVLNQYRGPVPYEELLSSLYYTLPPYISIKDVKIIPATLNFQYHFYFNKFKPYLGAGINYSFFDVKDKMLVGGVYGGKFDNAFGFVLQGGINYDFNSKWFVNFDIKKMFLSTNMSVQYDSCQGWICPANIAPIKITNEIDLNPLSIGMGIGYKFDWWF
ncbi:MAG: OmpW family outer membrane protein [Bacteroidota bacterium]